MTRTFDLVLDEIPPGEETLRLSLARWRTLVEGANLWSLLKSFPPETVPTGSPDKDCASDSKAIPLRALLINWFLCPMRDFPTVFFSVSCTFLLSIEFNIPETDRDFPWIDPNPDPFGNLEEALALTLACLPCKTTARLGGSFPILVLY